MKKTVLFLLLLSILSGFVITAEAVDISFSAQMDSTLKELIIMGQCDTKRSLTFYVTDTDISAYGITFEDNIYAMEQIMSEPDGSFSARIKMPDDLEFGSYKVIAGGVGNVDETKRSAVFTYNDPGDFSLWIEGEEAELSGNYRVIDAADASGGKRIAVDTTDTSAQNRAVFDFSLPVDATYDIWVLSTPGNVTYTSRYLYNFDSELPKQNDNGFIEQVYTTNDVRRVGIGWSKLDERFLTAGEHTLTFSCDVKRELENDFIYHVLDSVVVIPKSHNWTPNGFGRPYNINKIKINYKSGFLGSDNISRSDLLEVIIQASPQEVPPDDVTLWAAVVKDGEIVSSAASFPNTNTSEWETGKNYLTTVEIMIPSYAPDGVYDVVAGVGTVGQSGFYNTGEFAEIGKVNLVTSSACKPEKVTVKNAALTLLGNQIKAEFNLSDTNFEGSAKAFVKLWQGDVLWGVAEADAEVDLSKADTACEVLLTLPEGIPPGIYSPELGFYNINGTYKCDGIELYTAGDYGYKPLSNGVYKSQKTGRDHVWYVNQKNALIWDGEPYIPMGGMECLRLITDYSNSLEDNEARWAQDMAELDLLAEKGIKDLYINCVVSSQRVPDWVLEHIMDYLDKKGFRYSIQTNAAYDGETELYYIRSNPEENPIVLTGVTQSGRVTKDVSLSGMETYGTITPVSGLYALVDSNGNAVAAGECKLEKNNSEYRFEADITLPSEGNYSIYFTPKVSKNISIMANFWDYASETLDYAERFSKIPAGDGLRSIIDPLGNESGYYNGIESIRPCSEAHNAAYREYLIALYGTIDNLNKAWRSSPKIPDFDTASRIIPIYTGPVADNYSVFAIDTKNNRLYTLDARRGIMWNDYLAFRDTATAEFYNKTADAYKKGMDIPVIVKNVWGHKEYFINKNLVGGLDGLGCEAYGDYSRIANLQTETYGMANSFGKTAWLIVTETSDEENIQKKYDSGHFGYESEEYMHNHFDTLMEYGAKGIFDFLLSARHNEMTHITYSYVNKPEQFGWLRDYIDKLDINLIAEYVPDKKKVYIMPHNSNFYTYPNRYTAVLYDDSYKALDQACVQSDMMIMPTEDAHVFASVLAANFQNGPASYYQGKKFSNEILNMPVGKKAVYLGMREDLGSVPEIDKYFTDEYAYNADGVRVQVLKPSDSTQILMITPDNKPWAIRDGNLWIVSAEDAISSSGIKYLEEAGIFEADTGLASEDVYFAKDDQSRAQFLETGTYIFNAEIQNHTGLEQDIDVLLAFYDKEGRLIRLSSERKKLVCGLNTIGFETQAEENDYVLKGFLWGTDMTPLTEEVLLKRQE